MAKNASANETAPVTAVTTDYKALKKTFDDLDPDVDKAERGNKAAATRLRKAMSNFAKSAKDYRAVLLAREKAE